MKVFEENIFWLVDNYVKNLMFIQFALALKY